MATDPLPKNSTPTTPINPEDDAVLQAIEAIEARAIDPDPEPYNPNPTPKSKPVTPVLAPIPEETPEVIPIQAPTPPPAPKVVQPVAPKPQPVPVKPPEPVEPIQETPEVLVIEKPKTPKTPAEEMAEVLANTPPIDPKNAPFQPFPRRKPSKRSILIIVGVIVVLSLGVGGYFAWQSLKSS